MTVSPPPPPPPPPHSHINEDDSTVAPPVPLRRRQRQRGRCVTTTVASAPSRPAVPLSELHRTQLEFARLEERYKLLEKTLKDTRELLRAREVEVDMLRKDRDKLIVDRFSKERSPSTSLHRRRSTSGK
ncbi:hypothetical protein EV363DRAFT_1452914 [Boletus edulis]|nr:hypothetical protein EV363DRAFT_1452914 [Boletus edulis]